jgi:serine/threonine-protein kinase|tara:strand:+ start:251 stop:3010 length:2760 start_codon:yes stop_codon:yes gene_type:complete
MALSAGTTLGPYQITAKIGEGGMGEVYRARDTKLDRDVALKVLPEAFTSDPDRLIRFEREAKVLASLNHPNIAAIYGLEDSGDDRALVLELVEGPTLADRLAQGAIPIEDALATARQIAEGLEAAHERGIIHRDLKPANVKVRDDGTVKVLDFGLAKALDTTPQGDSSESATVTAAATQMGIILGTPAYMSPEQARGKPVDKRADIWAFGAVLYEMLSGTRAFVGDDVSDTMAAVLRAEANWDARPAALPGRFVQLVQRCLEKDPLQRMRDIGDVRLEMSRAAESDQSLVADATEAAPRPRFLVSALVGVALIAVGIGVLLDRAWLRGTVPPPALTRLTLDVHPGQHLSGGLRLEEFDGSQQRPSRPSFVLSPDGRVLVYVASDGDTTRLFRRAMDQAEASPIPETKGASAPFFAPDGQSVTFFVGATREGHPLSGLKRMEVVSGEVRTIATSAPEINVVGASWTENDTIVLSSGDAIHEVPSSGGQLNRLTTVDPVPGGQFRQPALLPGGRALLFNVATARAPSEWNIIVESLDTGDRRVVVEGGSDPRYVASGHLVFVRSGALMAVPFDVDRLEATGAPVVVVEDVMHAERGQSGSLNTGVGQFSVSRSGELAYVAGGIYASFEVPLVWVDLTGKGEPLGLPPGLYLQPRVSPDGTRLAYIEGDAVGGDTRIWIYDMELEVAVPVTTGASNFSVVWNPDGTQLVVGSTAESVVANLFLVAADGSGEPQRLTDSAVSQVPSSWSTDNVLAFVQDDDIMTMSMDGTSEPEPFLTSDFDEWWPAFSPDGRWLAYASNETGAFEVYVRPFPEGEPLHRISSGGGRAPVWSADGDQLLYRVPAYYMTVVDVETDPVFDRSQPLQLFTRTFVTTDQARAYDLAPDGQRFLMSVGEALAKAEPVTGITIVQNWVEELKARVPVP